MFGLNTLLSLFPFDRNTIISTRVHIHWNGDNFHQVGANNIEKEGHLWIVCSSPSRLLTSCTAKVWLRRPDWTVWPAGWHWPRSICSAVETEDGKRPNRRISTSTWPSRVRPRGPVDLRLRLLAVRRRENAIATTVHWSLQGHSQVPANCGHRNEQWTHKRGHSPSETRLRGWSNYEGRHAQETWSTTQEPLVDHWGEVM